MDFQPRTETEEEAREAALLAQAVLEGGALRGVTEIVDKVAALLEEGRKDEAAFEGDCFSADLREEKDAVEREQLRQAAIQRALAIAPDNYRAVVAALHIELLQEVAPLEGPPPASQLDVAARAKELKVDSQLTEMGNALMFEAVYSDTVRHCEATKSWYIWDGRRWRQDTTNEIITLARQVPVMIKVQHDRTEDKEEQRRLWSWYVTSQGESHMRASLNLSKGMLSITVDELDAHAELVNVGNGVLDLRSGQLSRHDPTLFLTKLIAVDYLPDAPCPRWERQLRFIDGGNPETIRYVQKAVAYTLAGRGDAKVLPFVYGVPDTGKSTFIETLLRLFGEYAYKIPVEILLQKGFGSGEGPTPYTRGMLGKRFVSATEMPADAVLDDGLVKDLAGGDTLVSRGLHRDPVNARPTHCVWLYGNNQPDVRDTSGGVFNRMALIPFRTLVTDTGVVLLKDMQDYFAPEMPGILAWAVRGYPMFLEEGLPKTESIRKATAAYETECDSIRRFIEECAQLAPALQADKKQVYNTYSEWAKTSGEHRLTRTKFTRTLKSRFNLLEGAGRRTLHGIGLTTR